RSTINRALLSPLTGYSKAEILRLDEEVHISRFRKYKGLWDTSGIYTALVEFVADYRVKQVLLQHHTENGERVITNLYQLIEILHKTQTFKNLSPPELINWLKRGIEGMQVEGDEYEQRVESDEEAVKIVTIHKSKGLEYNIVLAPYLDLQVKNKFETVAFRDEATQEYVSIKKADMLPEQTAAYERQTEQEYRRLLYVAVTRAVYKCILFQHTKRPGTLSVFLNALPDPDPALIRLVDAPEIPEGYRYGGGTRWAPPGKPGPVHFELSEKNWMRMSYSRLRADHLPLRKERSHPAAERYDHFMFHQLPGGINTGHMLHYIFENVQFSDTTRWQRVITDALNRFMPSHREAFLPALETMLEQVLQVTLAIDGRQFKLEDVISAKKIHEFEFDFTVPRFNTERLEDLSSEDRLVHARSLYDIEGLMNGKIDLFFEYGGRYYVLDWKSNFLGDLLSDYSAAGVATAMNENNYHLQYLIYTLAVKKYLESRLPEFDYGRDFGGVIYLFLRGVRKDAETGVFANKPSWETIESLSQILSPDIFHETAGSSGSGITL
ncbi:MAG TPA: 3'-5' exonuclease, partial [Sphingobacteriaceae bacterium]